MPSRSSGTPRPSVPLRARRTAGAHPPAATGQEAVDARRATHDPHRARTALPRCWRATHSRVNARPGPLAAGVAETGGAAAGAPGTSIGPQDGSLPVATRRWRMTPQSDTGARRSGTGPATCTPSLSAHASMLPSGDQVGALKCPADDAAQRRQRGRRRGHAEEMDRVIARERGELVATVADLALGELRAVVVGEPVLALGLPPPTRLTATHCPNSTARALPSHDGTR